jgi:Glycosyltransferase like family 2
VDQRAFDDLLELHRWRFRIEDPSLLDWTQTMRVRPRITDPPVRDARPNAPRRNTVVFGPSGESLSHPDRSVHIVVLDEEPSAATLAEARRVARDAIVVWARDGTVSVDWRRGPDASRPEVSVVVHSSDDGDRLDACLRSISDTTPVIDAIEIVVADAAQGSILARNRAADEARGDLLVFVGDRTLAQPGWLRPLVRMLRDEPDVGVVGGKLVAGDGTLAEAGGVVFADGSLASFGSGSSDPQAPLFGFVRDVHFVSADLLATRTGLFRRMGGIDGLLHEGYEDADYCLRVRAAGRRVVYQPQSVVVTDARPAPAPASDAGKRFVRRWTAPLAALPARPERFDEATWDRLARVA